MITLDQGGGGRPFVDAMPPPRPLAGLVEETAILRSDLVPVTGAWRIVPDTSAHLIFHRYRRGRTSLMVVGPRTRHVDVTQSERQLTVVVRFRPGALPFLTGTSAWELRDMSVDAAALFGAPGAEAAERLASVSRPAEVRDALQSMLLARVARLDAGRGEVDWRMRGLFTALLGRRASNVRHAARSLGVGERSLRAVTRDLVGLRPKEAARIVRLHRAVALSLAGCADADTAHRAGYSDQSHCIREFKRLLGETPRAFRARGLSGPVPPRGRDSQVLSHGRDRPAPSRERE